MENTENKIPTSNATVSHLKCNNCGSSHFTQEGDDTYVCNYCNSTIRLKDNIQDKFVSFFKPTTKETKNIYAVKPIVSKNQFWKNAIINLGMTPTTPNDVLDSQFTKVEQNYGYYVVFDVEFTIISISSEVKRSMGSVTLESNGAEKSSSFTSCIRLLQGNQIYEEAMLRTVLPAGEIYSNKISKDVITSLGKNFPTKEEIKQAIETEIARLKNQVQANTYEKNIKIVHNITNSAIYVIPEYTLSYNYQGTDYKLCCISCEDKLYGELPKATGDSLDKALAKKSRKVFGFPTLISLFSIIFCILGMKFFRYSWLLPTSIIIIIANTIIFLIANAIQKPMVVRLKTKYFEQKKQKVDEYVKNNKMPEFDSQDESNIGQYMRWY